MGSSDWARKVCPSNSLLVRRVVNDRFGSIAAVRDGQQSARSCLSWGTANGPKGGEVCDISRIVSWSTARFRS